MPYVPKVGDTTAPRDLREAADYYLTPRGQHPNAPNKMLFTSASCMVAFTGFDQVETLLTQPLMVIAGSEAGSLWHSKELHAKAAGPKRAVHRRRRHAHGPLRRQGSRSRGEQADAILQEEPLTN